MKKIIILLFIFCGFLFASNYFYMQNNKKIMLKKVQPTQSNKQLQVNSLNSKNPNSSNSSVDYYTFNSGARVGIDNTLVVGFKDLTNLKKYENTYHITFIKDLGLKMYVFSCLDKSKTLGIANELSKKNDILFAQPKLIQALKLQ